MNASNLSQSIHAEASAFGMLAHLAKGKPYLHTTRSKRMGYVGSNFDDFLKDEGIVEIVTAPALKKILITQIEEEMQAQKLTKTAMAQRMHTSRVALNRLLDDKDTSLTLTTLASAAAALGKSVKLELVAA